MIVYTVSYNRIIIALRRFFGFSIKILRNNLKGERYSDLNKRLSKGLK